MTYIIHEDEPIDCGDYIEVHRWCADDETGAVAWDRYDRQWKKGTVQYNIDEAETMVEPTIVELDGLIATVTDPTLLALAKAIKLSYYRQRGDYTSPAFPEGA